VLFFINQFCWTYDPRPEANPNHLPFITWDYQDEYIMRLEANYQANRDLLTEKSRDMGVSWMVLTWIVWHWLFDDAFNALIGSRKEWLVDNFEMDSLFGKVAYILDWLPPWILPEGFSIDEHRHKLRIVNPENGNTIQGESANTQFSRQGRYSVIMLDEFAFWEWASSVWTATADSAPVRFPVSTPKGRNNKFAELRFHEDGAIDIASLHWRLHPLKDEAWYEDQKARRSTRARAQELDMDYEASGNERVFSILRTNKMLRSKVIVPAFELPHEVVERNEGRMENGKPVITKRKRWLWRLSGGLDYGTRNCASFHVYAKDGDGVHWSVWEWRRTLGELRAKGWQGSMIQAIASMLLNECPYYQGIDVIWADPSMWAENQSTDKGITSLYEQMIDEGVANLVPGGQNDKSCIDQTLAMWADVENPMFRIFDTCVGQIAEFEGLEWDEWSEQQGMKKNLKETIVDKDNHSWDDWKYYATSKSSKPAKRKPEPKEASASWFQQKMKETQKQARKGVRLVPYGK